jgi:hypothetical protein
VFTAEVSIFIGDRWDTSADCGFVAFRGPWKGPIVQIVPCTAPIDPKAPILIFSIPFLFNGVLSTHRNSHTIHETVYLGNVISQIHTMYQAKNGIDINGISIVSL